MFSKLLKYEWKASSALLGILSLCALGVGLLGAGVLRGIAYLTIEFEGPAAALAVTGLSSMLGFIFLALGVYAFSVQFINLFRFYKSRFTDEGYLTFTLPVKVHQIFLSSFLHILLWLLITVVVVIAAVCLMVLLGAGEYLRHIWDELHWILEDSGDLIFDQTGYMAYSILSMVSVVVAPVYTVMLIMTSITIGSVLAKKHKILATIGIYYCIQMAISIAESILVVVPFILTLANDSEQYYVSMAITMGITMALQLGLTIGGYFLSTGLMKHKLNLP